MAEANTKSNGLYLDENVKLLKGLPNDMIRLCNSYEELNKQMEQNLTMAQNAFNAFENQSMTDDNNNGLNTNINMGLQWSMKDDLCLKHLQTMRKSEKQMLMFQDEKISLLEANVNSLEAYIEKINKDLGEFKKILQPNQIKLPFPNKKFF